MTDLERIYEWISAYPGIGALQKSWVDYYAPIPYNGNIAPAGLVEVSRRKTILGNVEVENQYNFGLYYVMKNTDINEASAENVEWILGLQQWVQDQNMRQLAPSFGDEPKTERIQASNAGLYATDEEGTATYIVQLTINFKKFYEVM